MAIIRDSGSAAAWRKKKKKKEKYSPPAGTQGRGGVAAPQPLPKAVKPPAAPKKLQLPKIPQSEHEIGETLPENIKNLHTAWTTEYGTRPTAQQMFEMLTSTNQMLSSKEWGGFIAPGLSQDPYTAQMLEIIREFYSVTGKLPTAQDQMWMMTGKKPVPSIEDFGSGKNPNILRAKGNDLYDIISAGANDRAAERATRPGAIWSKKDLKRLDDLGLGEGKKDADKQRKRANSTIHGDSMDQNEIDDIWKARGWYDPTSVKTRINARQELAAQNAASGLLTNPDGSDNKEAVDLMAKLTGQNKGDLKDPSHFVGLRDASLGKPYEKLSDKVKNNLQLFGAKLASIYTKENGAAYLKTDKNGHYIWNANFDRWASTFMFHSNLPAAVASNPYKKDSDKWKQHEKERRIATANISIATHGQVKSTDNLNDWLRSMGFLGDKDTPGTFSDKFTPWLFEQCYLRTQAPKGEPLVISVFKFAQQQGGPDSLPPQYRKIYDAAQKNWALTIGAYGANKAEELVNPLNVIFNSELELYKKYNEVYIPDLEQPDSPTGIPTISTVDPKTKRVLDAASSQVYELNEDGDIVFTPMHPGMRMRDIDSTLLPAITIDPDNEMDMWYHYTLMPKIEALFRKGPETVLNASQIAYNRVFLTAALIGEKESGRSIKLGYLGTVGPFSLAATDTGVKDILASGDSARYKAQSAISPWSLRIPADVRQYTWDNILSSWGTAGEMSRKLENTPYMRYEFERMGIDPEEHGTLLFWSDLSWSLGLDVLMDAGIGALAKGAATTSAKVMRSLTSEKLLAKIERAELRLAVRKGDAEIAMRELERQRLHSMADKIKPLDPWHAKHIEQQAEKVGSDLTTPVRPAMSAEGEIAYDAWRLNPQNRKIEHDIDRAMGLTDDIDYITAQLDTRPAWYDTFATGLAKSRLTAAQTQMVLGIKESHVVGTEKTIGLQKLLKRIGESTDRDDIIEAMNELRVRYALDLDSGKLWLGRLHNYDNIVRGNPFSSLSKVVPNDVRISRGAEEIEEHIMTVGTLSRAGLSESEANIEKAQGIVWKYIEKANAIDRSLPEFKINLQRQKIWREFNDEIKNNMKARGASAAAKKRVVKYARANGLKTDGLAEWLTDDWRIYQAEHRIKNYRLRGKDITGGGKTEGSWFDAVQPKTPFLLAGKKTAGQQASDLVAEFHFHDLISHQRGLMGGQMAAHTNLAGFLPSIAGFTAMGRTLALGTISFPLSALFIDEFYRFPVELLRGNLDYRHLIKSFHETRGHGLREVAENNFEQMVSQTHEFVPLNPNDPFYREFLDKHVKTLADTDLWDQYQVWRKAMVDDMGEDAFDAMMPSQRSALLRQHLVNFIEAPENADFRLSMLSTDRGFKAAYHEPAAIKAAQDEWVAAAVRMEDDLAAVRRERDLIKDDIKRLEAEPFELPAAGSSKGRMTTVGKALSVGAPTSKRWVSDWLAEKLHIVAPDTKKFDDAMDMTEEEARAWFNRHVPKNKKEYKVMYDKWRSRGWFGRNFPEKQSDLYKAMLADWKSEQYALKGLTEDYIDTELGKITNKLGRGPNGRFRSAAGLEIEGKAVTIDRLKAMRDAQAKRAEALNLALREHRKTDKIGVNVLDDRANEYIDAQVERLNLVNDAPELHRAATSGKRLSRSELKALQERGVGLPAVAGVHGHKTGWLHPHGQEGWLPLLSKFAEIGPYKALNAMGNATRKTAFLGNYGVQYRRLMEAGWTHEDAVRAATNRAKTYVDKVMYSPGMTPTENEMGQYFYFLPAFRQATVYWAQQVAKNPVLFSHLHEIVGEDMPMTWLGDYGSYLPLPFWAQGNPVEQTIPGLTAPILYPLRLANTLTGWDRVDDGKGGTHLVYSGNTKLDWLSENPFLNPLTGFASKNASPTAFFDELLYGFGGEGTYLSMEADNELGQIFYSLGYALRKDPMVRRKTAASIMLAQIANGDKPNTDAYQKRLLGSPGWYRLLAGWLNAEQPEALLGAVTRQFTPRKVTYSPSDIGEVKGAPVGKDPRSIWSKIPLFGDESARTIVGAEYEYYSARGDPAKQAEVLARYPKLKEKLDYYKLDAYDREQELMKADKRWLIPYVTGKNSYDSDGAPLTAAEYNDQMESGAMLRRENSDLMDRINRLYANADWSKQLSILEAERDKRLKGANKVALAGIKKYAKTPAAQQNWLKTINGYRDYDWGKTAPNEWDDAHSTAPWQLKTIARGVFGKNFMAHRLEWDPAAIALMFDDSCREIGSVGTEQINGELIEGQRPEGALYEGVEQYYSNDAVGKYKGEEGVKRMNRINDALRGLMMPEDKLVFSRSISAKAIKERTKKNKDFDDYKTREILTLPFYYIPSAKTLESAMPGIFDPGTGIGTEEEMDNWLYRASTAYDLKQKAVGVVPDYYSDAYYAAKKKYDNTIKRMMKEKIALPFRNGMAGRLLYASITDPGENKGWSRPYSAKVVKGLLGTNPDYEALVGSFKASSYNRPQKAIAANAWASTINAAIALREEVKKARARDNGTIGKTQDNGIIKLKRYTDEWSRESDLFRRQWRDIGGMSMINELLNESN